MALPFGAHVPFSVHNPSPLSFGFGLGIPQHHLPPPPPTPTTFHQTPQFTSQQTHASSSSTTAHRPLLSDTPQRTSEKRRRQIDDEDDAAMETGRSPSPADRPVRKLGAKKLRQTPLARGPSEVKAASQDVEDDVDIGSLLASLPPSSLLPLLTSLVDKKPELKPIVLSLIPRPTLETAVQAINEGAKRLREAYPYSLSSSSSSAGFTFGGGSSNGVTHQQAPGMRESYVRTRLRQPVRDFTKLLLSYMAYFSSTPTPRGDDAKTGTSSQPSASSTSTVEGSPKQQPVVPLHPADTFTFLHALTLHLMRMPPLTLAEFARPSENIVFPRLQAEWSAWVQKVDDDVNRFGRMYRDEVAKSWARGLDELMSAENDAVQQKEAGAVSTGGYVGMKGVRNAWVQRVGWLIGRRAESIGMEM